MEWEWGKNAKYLTQAGSLEDNHPDLLIDWDYANNTILPSKILSKSNRKVAWCCHICGTRWLATPNQRVVRKTNCPGCSGRVVVKGINDIFSKKPYLQEYWDFIKNEAIDPYNELISSKKNAYWLCPLCGKSYQKQIRTVALYGKKYCDDCHKQFQSSFPEQAVLFYCNKVFPDTISRYTEFGHEFDIYIPTIKTAIEYDGKAWHSTKNNIEKDNKKNRICSQKGIKLFRIREEGLPLLNNQCIVISVASNNDDSLQVAISKLFIELGVEISCNIKQDYALIMQSYRIIKREQSLEYRRPDLAAEFNIEKNMISPSQITLNANRKFWWNCPNGHEPYLATPNSRNNRGCGCPTCAKKERIKTLHRTTLERNGLLKNTRPDLIKEIDSDNHDNTINLELLQTKDDKIKIPWKCTQCGFKWTTTAYSRTVYNTGCPSCSHSKVVIESHNKKMNREHKSLQDMYPQIALEWHPTKNGAILPSDISYGSIKKRWWICPKCGHEYQTSPNNRTSAKSACPKCKFERINKAKERAVQNIETGQIFESVKAANKFYGKKQTNISAVCRGERKVALGYHWQYVDKNN